MRKNNIIRLIIFGIVLMLFGCSEDLYDEHLNSDKHPILVKRKNFEDLKKNKKLMKSIERFTVKSENSLQRQHYDSINNFYIDLDNDMFTLDSLNHQTYTFKVTRIPSNGLFENLILKTSKTGDFDAVLVQYNENIMVLNSAVTQEILNSINQNVNFIYLGKKNISEINSKFVINEECFEPAYVYMSAHNCTSGEHSFSNGSVCDYWGTSDMATTGGYVYTIIGVVCPDGGAGSSELGGDFSTGPHGGGGGGGIDDVLVTPCTSLKKVNLKVKSSLSNLSINAATAEHGEYGYSFQVNSSNSLTLPVELAYSPLSQIGIPTFNNIYGAAHTHPLSAFYMFSFSDVYTLLSLYSAANTTIKKDVVFMLINPDGSTYAIKIDDIDVFTFNMQAKLNATGIYGSNPQPKVNAADRKLNEIYNNTSDPTDSNKLARVFLEHFNGSGMSLYKSTGNFDGWKKLSLPTNPSSPTLIESPCN